ncbi:hypothetical protein CHS0354_040745 [Potamilus streckersoni]|uniref:Uncharacterized protein n=1 Tax=Potamilus streckersoni TaxID=2493646 RepID=A0AAE0VXU8_9BIVA|nr:hypothetical protein CHS0354_040745 [Potamilus streckersoni]
MEELEKSGIAIDEKERLELDAHILKAVEAQKHLHENIDRIFDKESLLMKQTDIQNKYQLNLRENGGVPPSALLNEEERMRLIYLTLTDMEGTVRGIVRCAKILPEFASLSLEDQASLIKRKR